MRDQTVAACKYFQMCDTLMGYGSRWEASLAWYNCISNNANEFMTTCIHGPKCKKGKKEISTRNAIGIEWCQSYSPAFLKRLREA